MSLGKICWAVLAVIVIGASVPANARAAEPPLLDVAIVADPDFPPLSDELVQGALFHAEEEFTRRFGTKSPRLRVRAHYSVETFMKAYAPASSACVAGDRYRGTGEKELQRHSKRALAFFQKWKLATLRDFLPEADRAAIRTHQDLYDYYRVAYPKLVASIAALETPKGTPLIAPEKSQHRSFTAWKCALENQAAHDVIITNTFILADSLDEPHPHAVFGRGKVGGIAAPSPRRRALGGQALLATTFGIDTPLKAFRELPGGPRNDNERSQVLGAYLLAHEIAHARFGIPDVFDHPAGCLMTTRPGEDYRSGLKVLARNDTPCPRCRPYVASELQRRAGRDALAAGKATEASRHFLRAVRMLPKHVHGSRRRRIAKIMLGAAEAAETRKKLGLARKYAKLAADLNPQSEEAVQFLESLRASQPHVPARTSSTASSTTASR